MLSFSNFFRILSGLQSPNIRFTVYCLASFFVMMVSAVKGCVWSLNVKVTTFDSGVMSLPLASIVPYSLK